MAPTGLLQLWIHAGLSHAIVGIPGLEEAVSGRSHCWRRPGARTPRGAHMASEGKPSVTKLGLLRYTYTTLTHENHPFSTRPRGTCPEVWIIPVVSLRNPVHVVKDLHGGETPARPPVRPRRGPLRLEDTASGRHSRRAGTSGRRKEKRWSRTLGKASVRR